LAIDVGSRIRDYEIVARLKAGGMATLFLARRTGAAGFSRHVAMKVVHPHLAADPSFIRMFIDEALLSARIQHPNVVHVEELGEDHGTYFLAMEYVHGSALSTLLGALARLERRLSPEIAVSVACQVLDGLHAAHELRNESGQPLGVVHRDVSPQNVLVSTSGHIKLIDFGIAKVQGQGKRTETGSLKGKIRYMAPEQAYGRPVDRRTDTYALAIVLWEMLTMHRMFGSGSDLAVLDMVRNPTPEPPSRFAPGIPPALDAAILAGLAPSADHRPATAIDLKRMLLEALPGAATVDASQLAEIVEAVIGERMEARRAALPDSLSGLQQNTSVPPARGGRSLARSDVLAQLTVSAPGVKFTADQDVSEVGPAPSPFADASRRVAAPAASTSPGATPRTGMSGERMVAIGAGAIALVAMGVAGGVMFGARGGDVPGATAPPPSLPVVAAPVVSVPATVAPDPPAVIAEPDAGADAGTARRSGGPRRPGGRERDRDRTVVGGVPIYDDDDF
jgi:eukaryotic-like serine/threonine-protein kinase